LKYFLRKPFASYSSLQTGDTQKWANRGGHALRMLSYHAH
jgi:hypothetical protein